jgi:DNA-directed RNA polymerase specialized sigma24 family protein
MGEKRYTTRWAKAAARRSRAAGPGAGPLAEAHLGLARSIAARHAVRLPRLADDLESAALLGLWRAALDFDAGRGVPFRAYARLRIAGEVRDLLRGRLPLGYGPRARAACPGLAIPTVRVESDRPAGPRGHAGDLASLPADEGPVGWELEYEEEVESIARRLKGKAKAVVRAYGLDCRGVTGEGAALVAGVSAIRASQVLLALPALLGPGPGADGRASRRAAGEGAR